MKIYLFDSFIKKRHNKARNLSILNIVFFLIFLLFSSIETYGYSSNFPEVEKKEQPPVMYHYHVNNMREQRKPKFIHHVDSFYYRQGKSIYQKGILFTVKSYSAKNAYFVSNLDNYQRHPMRMNRHGVWYYIYPIKKAKQYSEDNHIEYHFFSRWHIYP